MDSFNLSQLSLSDDNDNLCEQFSRTNVRDQFSTSIVWRIILYADYENDNFIFVAVPVNSLYDISEDYNLERIANLKLTFFYNDDLIHVELSYTSFPEIERWPFDFCEYASIYMLLPDFSLTNEGFVEVDHFNNFLEEYYRGEINIFKDPLYGKACRAPLIIKNV